MRPLIALLTDFGLHDHYVGTMKGVMVGICPEVALVDITHDIAPQDVLGGALELAAAYRFFPAGTVFLCVVDPGVGSARRAIAARARGYTFVAPDNGLVSLAVGDAHTDIVALTNPAYALAEVSHTFEGRDRFAPAAAWLARGTDLPLFGPALDRLVRVDVPAAKPTATSIEGEVVRVDRFGNLVTNIASSLLDRLAPPTALAVAIADRSISSVAATYAEIPHGDVGALVGSTGHLEVSVSGGNAAATLGCGRGAAVRVARRA